MDPNPDVHLAADQLTENHSDCLRSLFGDQPHGVLGVDPAESRADLVIDTAGRSAGAVAGGTENGRSTRCWPELSGRSISVKLSRLFRSSRSAAIRRRESLVS